MMHEEIYDELRDIGFFFFLEQKMRRETTYGKAKDKEGIVGFWQVGTATL